MTTPPITWDDYASDSFDLVEFKEQQHAVHHYVAPPGPRPDLETVRRYFRSADYPYPTRMETKAYYREKYRLQIELVKLQNWIKETGGKLLVLMEGRDAAGKGSTIKRFMEYLNPRGATVVALDKPSDLERGQWYFQRYVDHLPGAGQITFFDRSWYNRAGVERVMGFCTRAQYWEFVRQAPMFEQMLTADGITLFKFYLSISKEEQATRFEDRRRNPLKQWKLSPIDIEAHTRWDAYTQAKEETMRLTDTEDAPWTLIKADDKLRARLETMRVILHRLDYADKDVDVVGTPDPWIVAPAGDVFE